MRLVEEDNSKILVMEIAKQGSWYNFDLKPHRRDKMFECHGRKYHEGKTSGSILHGLAYARECTQLVNFCIHDMKKIPVDALGTLRNT
jgi:hypothetical protein